MNTTPHHLSGTTRLEQFRRVAESRFSAWREKHANRALRKQKKRRTATLSPLGRADRRREDLIKRLEREVRKRGAIQLEVAREKDCPEMLSAVELDRLTKEW